MFHEDLPEKSSDCFKPLLVSLIHSATAIQSLIFTNRAERDRSITISGEDRVHWCRESSNATLTTYPRSLPLLSNAIASP
jgi:hypothetical protein